VLPFLLETGYVYMYGWSNHEKYGIGLISSAHPCWQVRDRGRGERRRAFLLLHRVGG
jgi:metallophosphoesterase superfamily enzyme